MSEKEPRPDNSLTLEQEVRKQRYLTNLDNIQNSDLEDLYPPEMKRREWSEVTDDRELDQARKQLGDEIPPQLYGLYKDKSGEYTYFVSRFNKFPKMRDVQLDMLATAKEIAPWARQEGLVYERAGSEKEAWSAKCGPWSFRDTLIQSDMVIIENVVNGLGDSKYSREQKQTFLRNDIAAIVHENTHINNTETIGLVYEARIISETAPMAAEYLSFPGKNSKMKAVIEKAGKLLRSEEDKYDLYDKATLMGMLIMARSEGLLPDEENILEIDAGIARWQAKVENLLGDELTNYRRKVEQEWLLSKNDEKLEVKLVELKQQYPELINRILGDYKLKGEE